MYSKPVFNEKQREILSLFNKGFLDNKIKKLKLGRSLDNDLVIVYVDADDKDREIKVPSIMNSQDIIFINTLIEELEELVSEEHIIENLGDISLLDKDTIIHWVNGKKLKVVGKLEDNLTIAVSPYYSENSQTSHNTYYIPFELVIGSKVKTFD